MKKLPIIPANNWSKPRNPSYTLSDALIVHSLKNLTPHRPGDEDLPFHVMISPEQKLPCAPLASCRICLFLSLLLSNLSQHLYSFLWLMLHLCRGHLSKCCLEALYFNSEFPKIWSWHFPLERRKEKFPSCFILHKAHLRASNSSRLPDMSGNVAMLDTITGAQWTEKAKTMSGSIQGQVGCGLL